MDFFSNVKDSIINVGQDMSQKRAETNEVSKVNSYLEKLENNYYELVSAIGEKMYTRKYLEMKTWFPKEVAMLDQTRKEIEDCNKELALLKGARVCPNCGAQQSREAIHCANCGHKLQDVSDGQQDGGAKFCKNCGHPLKPGARFCAGCGTQV